MAQRRYNQFFYTLHKYPVQIDCNFIVDSTNGNGLGIRSLKGGGVGNVFMHTTQAPGTSAGQLNPNPAAGYISVQFTENYNFYYAGTAGFVSPLSGTPLTAVTNHTTYVIVSLGTATLAQWQAVGLPRGIAPAVGVAFVATATGTIGGSAAVEVIAATGSGIDHIEVVGDPNKTILSSAGAVMGQPNGSSMQLACFLSNAVATPADGTVIGLSFLFSNSSVTVAGD